MENSCLVSEDTEQHSLQVKIQSGASIVKVRPLFASDSKHFIVASGINVKIFNISSAECIQTLKKHKVEIVSLQENKRNHLQIYSCDVFGIVIRWDYLEGQVLEIYNLEVYPVAAFYAPTPNEAVFLVSKLPNEDAYGLCLLSLKSEGKNTTKKNKKKKKKTKKNTTKKFKYIFKYVLPQENAIAFGAECSFVASVMGNELQLEDLKNGQFKRHLYGDRTLLCVACHPTDNILATGDNHGRVFIWANALNSNSPTKSLYHWHTLPVADLSFSSEGTYLYSGGGEHTLVKWHLGSEVRHILPRLGLPIYRVAVSPDNLYIVTAHEDNALQIINSLTKVVQIIQGLTQGHRRGNGNIFSTGMLYDSRSEALVMNGKPGHLQFYNIQEDKQLFNLDIVGRNVISQERNIVIVNTDVQKAALDTKGQWLATVEYWSDGEMNPEIRLKFWEFDASKQTFVLNTYVFLPHNKEVNYVGFRPFYEDSDCLPLAVTSSSDGKFKTWVLNYEDSPDKKESWSCESMGYYRDLPAGDACFSQDGSLLGVAFGHVATLWEPDSMVLKARFFQPKNDNNLRQVMFGNGSCCHLLVCSSNTAITVWNVLTLSVQLTIKCNVQFLAPDRKSDVIAAFCNNKNLVIFKPSNPRPICYMRDISKTAVIAAIFVPKPKIPGKEQLNSNCWHKNSQLFFLNKDQNLLTIADESDEEEDSDNHKVKVEQNIPVTPFGMLQAQQKITDVKSDFSKLHISVPEVDAKIFDVSCPTNQNPIALCSLILPSLLIKLDKKKTDVSKSLNFEENRTKLYSTAPEAMDVDKVIPAKESVHMTDFVGITDFSFLRKSVKFSMGT